MAIGYPPRFSPPMYLPAPNNSRFQNLRELVQWACMQYGRAEVESYMGRQPHDYRNYVVQKIEYEVKRFEDSLRQPNHKYQRYAHFATQYALATKPKNKIIDRETVFGEITAFRVWRVTENQTLRSTFKETIWEPQQILQAHAIPGDSGCDGIHGWKSLFEAIQYVQGLNDAQIAVGRVKLWGEVVEHERGYRAEFAKIIGIDDLIGEITGLSQQYDMANDSLVEEPHRNWSGQDLQSLQDKYFPEEAERRKARENAVKKDKG